jgi:hypothetical protein
MTGTINSSMVSAPLAGRVVHGLDDPPLLVESQENDLLHDVEPGELPQRRGLLLMRQLDCDTVQVGEDRTLGNGDSKGDLAVGVLTTSLLGVPAFPGTGALVEDAGAMRALTGATGACAVEAPA